MIEKSDDWEVQSLNLSLAKSLNPSPASFQATGAFGVPLHAAEDEETHHDYRRTCPDQDENDREERAGRLTVQEATTHPLNHVGRR